MNPENKKNKNAFWLILILLLCGVIVFQQLQKPEMPPSPASFVEEQTGQKLPELSLYVREKILQDTVSSLRESNGSSVYNIGIYSMYMGIIKKYFPSIEGLHLLEIGPGSNLASGTLMVLGGVDKYYGVDIYKDPEFYNPLPFQSLSLLIKQFIPELNRFPLNRAFDFKDNKVVYNEDRIVYLYPYLSSNFPMNPGVLDFVFSHSTLEHVITPQQTVVRISETLKPGGITAHGIDLRDHDDFTRPYEFLKYDGKIWADKFNDENIHLYTNRWRAKDYIKAFREAGFEILEQKTESAGQITEETKKTFSPEFQKYTPEELAVTHLTLVARKPKL